MIKSFKHRALSDFYTDNCKKAFNVIDLPKITRILDRLSDSLTVNDMNIPGWNLHELRGDRKGVWSVAVRKNWKITFRFEKGNAYQVNFEDYH